MALFSLAIVSVSRFQLDADKSGTVQPVER